jgi:iron transport multicopper oxidase
MRLLPVITALLPALLSQVTEVQADAKSYTLNIANAYISPDGFYRSASLANGQFPGPLLSANKGDSMSVTVNNQLSDSRMRRSTSIHWHGIYQTHNGYNDGPAFVTQCPIAPGNSYTYNVNIGQQTGTYWYHSHLSSQYVDGVRGPLVSIFSRNWSSY